MTITRPDSVGAHAVAHDAGDQVRVRHDNGRAVEGLDLGRAHVDPAHIAFAVAHDHEVADADRPLPQEDQARDEVVDDGLQAKTDTDRQRAGDDGDPVEAQAQIGEGDRRPP